MEEELINPNLKQRNEDTKKELEISEITISKRIDEAIEKMSESSENSRNNLSITQILSDLSVILDDFEIVKNTISDQQSHTLYILLHKFIKKQKVKATHLSSESSGALQEKNENKLKMIKSEVLEMMQQGKILYSQVFKESQNHILWMDKKLDNNQRELQILQKMNFNNVIIKQYTNDNLFRDDIIKLKDYPLIIIMSASAAGGNAEYSEGNHLEYVLSIKNHLRLRGIIIFCGIQGQFNMKKLLNDSSNMICTVVTERTIFISEIERLVTPNDFKRVVPLKHLDYYLCESSKKKILNWRSEDWSQLNLLSYKTKKIDSIFTKAKKLIIEKKIKILQEVINQMDNISKFITEIFQMNDTEEQLCIQFMSLYSKEKRGCHKFLNSVLNIINDDLIFSLKEIFDIFLISFYKYDDSKTTIIKKPVSGLNENDLPSYQLYRGTSIPTSFINSNELDPQQYITLPSFSSFTLKQDIALKFMIHQRKFGDCTFILLSYKFQTGTKNYDFRPKCIKGVSVYSNEEEYLVYPFTTFFILSIKKESIMGIDYLFVELS